ncbi:MAG: tol-pal system protein YbgF [Thermoanaerobaculia bacterium]
MPPRLPRALAFCALLLLAGGCVSSGPYWDREDQGAAEATELRERVTRLEGQLAAAEGQNTALRTRAEELEREVGRLRQGAAAVSGVTPAARIAQETASAPAPNRSAEIEQSDLDVLDEPPVAAARGAGLQPPPAPSAAEGPRALYEQSLELLEQNRLPEADEGFRRFLAENPASDLADNAQFWLAESALRRADVPAALAGFRAVVENYPEANKIPDALLKVGYCLAMLGETESAATVYRELLTRYPETAAAETARQRLGNP